MIVFSFSSLQIKFYRLVFFVFAGCPLFFRSSKIFFHNLFCFFYIFFWMFFFCFDLAGGETICSFFSLRHFIFPQSKKIGCRKIFSSVHSANFTSQTNFGFNHVTGMLVFGLVSNGHLSVINGSKLFINFFQTFSLNPEPLCQCKLIYRRSIFQQQRTKMFPAFSPFCKAANNCFCLLIVLDL